MSDYAELLARLDALGAISPMDWYSCQHVAAACNDAAAAIRAQAERIKVLEKALLHITNPVDWERNNLRQGYELNVPMLLSMIDKPEYYKDVASKALRSDKEEGK